MFSEFKLPDSWLCAELDRPSARELISIALVAFLMSVASAAAPRLLRSHFQMAANLYNLPSFLRWRAWVTVAALHQPVAMLILLPPSEVWRILTGAGNPWIMTAPRTLWLALFYLFGAWAFEVLCLIHPATGAFKAYGRKGWCIQIVHHVVFPSFAIHNIFSGCAVPGVAVACCTELTVLFTSTYWLLLRSGVPDEALQPLRQGMQVCTYALRGVLVLILDFRALANDQKDIPFPSWIIQCHALVLTNVLNFMIISQVKKSSSRKKEKKSGSGGGRPATFDLGSFARPGPCPVAAEVTLDKVRDHMKKVVQESTGLSIHADAPLMEAGLTSQAAMDLYNRLSSEMPGVNLPTMLIFDYPTVSAVANYAMNQIDPVANLADSVRGYGSGMSDPLAVVGVAANFPGGACNYAKLQQGLAAGCDAFVEVPFMRWELSEYWDPNPDAPGKMYPRHGGFVEGAEKFDADFFAISAPEARAMDPQQRLIMETSFEAFLDGGYERASLIGSEICALIGVSNNDWIQVQSGDIRKLTPYTATGTSASISAARVAYGLGLKGPSYIVDTACSSALVALDSAAMNLRRGRCEASMSSAANVMASAATFISFSKPRMLSPQGRCFTFDASADGYGRGEGSGAVVLRPLSEVPELAQAVLRGIAVNQDGRSATMTAPNGPSQQSVMTTALREAGIVPKALGHMECHGTGTGLGDPIEIGALGAINAGRADSEPLVLAAVKSNVGHLEGAAACPGLVKTVAILRFGASIPNNHLVSLNPHISNLTDFMKSFPTECSLLTATAKSSSGRGSKEVGEEDFGTGGLSSFGFGGTNAHAVLAGARQPTDPRKILTKPAPFNRRMFNWREQGYRLLRSSPEEGTFEVTMSADVYDVASHHIVFESIVVPGVVFTEMALEATRKLFGHRARLTDVTMVFPFVVPYRKGVADPAPIMRFAMKGEKRFQIQSTSVSGKVQTHVEAGIDLTAKDGEHEQAAPVDLDALRKRIDEPVASSAVYEAIHSVGLWLGPMFQVAKQVWRKEDNGKTEVLAMLKLDPKVPNTGYVVHPALFDGTIHTLAAGSIGKDHVGGLMIFGGVGRVMVVQQENFSQLDSYWIHLDIFEVTDTSQTFHVKVLTDSGSVLMMLDNVVFRSVKPEQIQMAIAAQGTPEDDQKMYEVEWIRAPASSTEEAPEEKQRCLVVAWDKHVLEVVQPQFGDEHKCLLFEEVMTEDWQTFDRLVSVIGMSTAASALDILDATLQLMKKLTSYAGKAELWLVTCSTQATSPEDMKGAGIPLHAGLWGLARTYRNERPDMQTFCLDLPGSFESTSNLLKQVQDAVRRTAGVFDPEVVIRTMAGEDKADEMFVPRLMDSSSSIKLGEPISFNQDATYLISGGLGALGLMFAKWMLEKSAKHVVLMSRRSTPPKDCAAAFKKLTSSSGKSSIALKVCDVTATADVKKVVQSIKDEAPALRGIFHAAGSLRDHLIADLQRADFEAVLGPKIDGTLNLHEASAGCSLDFLALFSTIANIIGSPGQANYNSANAFMDAFALHRRAHDKPAVSVQWGPWADVGMAARAGTSEGSISRIDPERGLEAMEAILSCQGGLQSGVVGVACIKWKSLLGQAPKIPLFFDKFKGAIGSTKSSAVVTGMTQDAIKSLVVSTLEDIMGEEDLDLSTPLMEMGLDSLAGVEFRNRLQASFEGLSLSPTMMFDYPTVPDLIDYIYEQVGSGDDDVTGGVVALTDIGEQLAIVGMSGRVPGSLTNNLNELWHTLVCGLDTTSELPPERWDVDAIFDEDPDAPGKTYVKLGHFIPGIESFDGQFFGVGEAELRGMDPHQWLTVEITYDAFHAAGFTKESLNGVDCGVYVGCATLGGLDVDLPAFGPFTNIGYAYSGLSGRVSHVFSLRGPCFTIDTACSSTVVALDCGCQALRLGRCVNAVASGVNLQLSAAIWVGFSKMRGLAPDGRCKTFDVTADGFARGEGLGSVFVQHAAACTEENPPLVLLSGVATNHDGRAATITAPNGTAQQRVIRAALAERGTKADDVACLECHGTGTALGDPIEVGGQKAVYGKGRPAGLVCVLAAVKSNLGHLEGSAGVTGVSKAVMMLQREQVPTNLWLKNLNANIELTGFDAIMPTEFLYSGTSQKRASVSSFGFSGTNGHAVVEQTDLPVKPGQPVTYARRLLKPVKEWLQSVFYLEQWVPVEYSGERGAAQRCLIVGEGPVATKLCSSIKGAVSSSVPPAATKLAEDQVQSIVFACHVDANTEEVPGETLAHLLKLLQASQQTPATPESLLILTRGAWDAKRSTFDAGAALWGLIRTARLEMPRTSLRMLDVEVDATAVSISEIVEKELLNLSADLEVSYSSGLRSVPRLVKAPTAAASLQRGDAMSDHHVLKDGAHLITGGLGSLGLIAAHELAELGAPSLILASRSGRVTPGSNLDAELDRLQAYPRTKVLLQRLDVSSEEEVAKLASEAASRGAPLRGVLHAAGVLDKCSLADLSPERLTNGLKPKAHGAWYLHKNTQAEDIGMFVLFSSVSATVGLANGASYSAGSAYLDALARWRWEQYGGLSVKFGPVAGSSMTDVSASRLGDAPLKTLPSTYAASALRLVLAKQGPQAPPSAEVTLARADWGLFMREIGVTIPQLSDFKPEGAASAEVQDADATLARMPAEERQRMVLESIRSEASGMGLEIEDDTPLMEAGIDSLSAVEFRSKVSKEFRQVRLPSTLMFDYPTLKALSMHISSELAPLGEGVVPSAALSAGLPALLAPESGGHKLSVLGASSTLPGNGQALKGVCSLLTLGADGISEVSLARWDVSQYYNAVAPTPVQMYVNHAGFIEGADLFDAEAFNISKPEASAMDPQQRHLLETAFKAFIDAGFTRNLLMRCAGGSFVGQDKCDWNRMLTAAHAGPFAATGGSASISSNRISYALGLRGPSCTMDTACSSSLVAADTAAMSLRRGRCTLAAVSGVNMLLLPQTFIACCQAHMLSVSGHCRTFDTSASGYARGEGCGSQIIEPFTDRVSLVSLGGSALNQDGRSANLTSPNGPAQQEVVLAALLEAGVLPQDLGFLETHGTGTELGDPIEVGALRAALGGTSRSTPLLLGAVKTNVGHLEGGAGMAGLMKLLSILMLRRAPMNLHLRVLNGHLHQDRRGDAEHFMSELSCLELQRPTSASVSSFGFGGTNGHVLLQVPTVKSLSDSGSLLVEPLVGKWHVQRPTADLQPQGFPWREPGHPLIRKRSERDDGATVYSCPIDGHVLDLLSHHIVHGEVVVPGACYLEMILAGVTEHVGRQNAWCIERLGFAKPLVLRIVDGKMEEPVELRLLLWQDGRLEVESEVGADPEESIETTHVEATLVLLNGGWKANKPPRDVQDLDALRSKCPDDIDIDLMYSFGVRCGLPLQKRFRGVRQVQRGEKDGFARLEMERDGTHVGFWLGPSLIDSTFQALMSLGDKEHGIGSLKIPLSIRRLQPTGRTFSIAVWSYFELKEFTERSTVFQAWHFNDAGEVLLHFEDVHLQEVRDEHIQKVLQASGRQDTEQRALYGIEWRSATPLDESQPAADAAPKQLLVVEGSESAAATSATADMSQDQWLVLGGPEAMRHLSLENDVSYHCVTHGEGIDLLDEPAVAKLLQEEAWTAVVFAAGLLANDDVDTLVLALHLVRAAVHIGAKAPPIWLVTCGAQPLTSDNEEAQRAGSTAHAGLWGFARAARAEYPDSLRISCLDIDPLEAQSLGKSLSSALPTLCTAEEQEVAIRDGHIRISRLTRSSVRIRGPTRLNMPVRGSLTGLRPVPQASRRPVLPGYVQLRIRAVGLNFRDVLNVMGLYPGDPGPPGADCSGTVLELGDRVDTLRLGDDVFGEAPGCLSTYSLGPAALLERKPDTWTFEQASTMPVIFVTVEEALGDLARLKKGERVLIHAAAGGVGLVAIQYAQFVGAEVYATAGAEEKHEFLRQLGVKYITSTRNGQQFEEDMKRFLAEDGVDGIDVVLNSLSHDDYIPRSLALLRKGGRFMEIGKRGIWSHEEMAAARPDVQYEKIAADTMMETDPWRYHGYLRRLLDRVDAGGLKPINMHVFEGLEKGVQALEFLQRAKNIGKVIISEPSRMQCRPNGTFLLSGGLGAVGQVAAQFLVEEGCKSLCLLSRGGKPSSSSESRWQWLQACTAAVSAQKCDVGQEASVLALRGVVSEPLCGLLHLAGVLADGLLPSLTKDSFQKSYGPKVHGLHHLRKLSFEDSAIFILFSSTSALFGAPGQANYSAANSVLDSIAPHWRAKGSFQARSIQWGPWGEVGMAVEKNTLQRTKASGLGALNNVQCMTIMGSVLFGGECLVGACPIKWSKFLRTAYVDVPRFLEDMEVEAQREAPVAAGTDDDKGNALALLAPEERRTAIREVIHRLAQDVTDSDDLELDSPLLDSGMDSLSGVEFRNRLLMEFSGVRIPNSAVFDYPTVDALAEFVNQHYANSLDSQGETDVKALANATEEEETPAANNLLEHLNDRKLGVPLFLVPGAGMQSGAFRSLASLLPVPAYGASWPRGWRQRDAWPGTLRELAELLLQEVRSLWPSGPYMFAGHSFGAAVCLEIAYLAEAEGLQVALVALLDPRSIPPVEADLEQAFADAGLADSLAMLAQSAGDGSRYGAVLDEVVNLAAADRDAAVRQTLSKGALESLEHVHETTQWYAKLLADASKNEEATSRQFSGRLVVLLAAETWLSEDLDRETKAEAMVRKFQASIFQRRDLVERNLREDRGHEPVILNSPGGHFTMLQEPHVVAVALRLCHSLVEAEAGVR